MASQDRRALDEVVLDNLDWLWREWWLGQPDELSRGDLRRASASLRLLLLGGAIQQAWIDAGFAAQPSIIGPDLDGLAAEGGLRLDLAASCVAGGGRQGGIDVSFIGAFGVDNPTTGMPADADEGFAVRITYIARDASAPTPSDLDRLVEKPWPLSNYLESAGAVRRGQRIRRREIVQYFANFRGGVHLDAINAAKIKKRDRYELIAELEGHVIADVREGLAFELLSIGQAVAHSPDMRRLADALRKFVGS